MQAKVANAGYAQPVIDLLWLVAASSVVVASKESTINETKQNEPDRASTLAE